MVGKDEQYIFIHRALYDYWRGLRAYSPTFSASSTLDIEQAEEAREDIHENQGRYFQW